MNRILFSLGTLVAVGAVVAGGTIAFFQDTETSEGNIFVAGSIDLKVDHTYAEYNGERCDDCVEGQTELIVNGGFEEPALNSGQWNVYPENSDDEVPGWDVTSGAGIEIQSGGNWGAPHGGNQLAELDSHTPGDTSSGIEQIISTDPGQQYRLTFYHSPRPGNGPSGGTDNAIELDVLVTSVSGTLVNATIGQPSFSGSGTVWTEYVYDFVALDSQTTIRFTDVGSQQDTLGGYLDDVSVRTLDCSGTFTAGGTCTLWDARDLNGETFWNFNDVKPGDRGTSVISLHVDSNDAYSCLFPGNIQDDENTVVDPEIPAGDNNLDGIPNGELSGELEFFFWHDANANNQFDLSESVLVVAGTPLNQIQSVIASLPLQAGAPVELIGVSWCAGTQTLNGTTIECDGSGMGNIAQTDKTLADFIAYAEQQRNNLGFSCANVNLGGNGGGNAGPTVGANLAAYNGPVQCSVTVADGQSIQAAIDSASPGDVICVADGTHDNDTYPLRINKDNLTLAAVNGPTNTAMLPGGVIIDNPGVTLTGFHINGESALLGAIFGVYVNGGANNVEVSYNRIEGNDTGASRGIVTVTNNVTDTDILHNHITNWATGVFLNPSVDMLVKNNTLENNVVGSGNDGPSNNVISHNIIRNNSAEGVGYSNAGQAGVVSLVLNYNNIYDNGANPGDEANIYIVSTPDLDAENNWWGDLTPTDEVNDFSRIDTDPFAPAAYPEY